MYVYCIVLIVFDNLIYNNTSVVQFLKVTKKLPSTKDEYDFYLSYPTFMAFSKNQGQRVLQLIGKVSRSVQFVQQIFLES